MRKCCLWRALLAVCKDTTAESEPQHLRVAKQTRYALHWCQLAQVNDGIVKFKMEKPVCQFIFVLNLMWPFQFCCQWDVLNVGIFENVFCILKKLDLCIEVALQQKNAWTVFTVFLLLLSIVGFWYRCVTILKCKDPPCHYSVPCAFRLFLLFFTCLWRK